MHTIKPAAAGRAPEMTPEISIAPMLDVTDRHFRMFMRALSARVKLYTEMKTCGAVLHGERERMLGFDRRERPLAIQLGGAEPGELAHCARLAEEAGYDEVNLNVGCPSARVQSGRFGACLMAEPELVARCVAAMRAAVALPVTVKTRIGIDRRDRYAHLADFVARVAEAGCAHFIVHARKAWLRGLSPKENRNLPPLQYERVYRLKRQFPELLFSLNGGVKTPEDARRHLQRVDGVMIGREAQRDPWMLRRAEHALFGGAPAAVTRAAVVRAHLPYIEQQLARGVGLRRLILPMVGLYHGRPRARAWRRHLSEAAIRRGAGAEVVVDALELTGDDDDLAAMPPRENAACGVTAGIAAPVTTAACK